MPTPLRAAATLLFLAPAVAAQSEAPGARFGPFTSSDARFVVEVVATGFQTFSGLAVLPDGRAVAAERPTGRLSLVDLSDGHVTPIAGVPPVQGDLDAGLIEVLPHPEFSRNHLLYYVYAEPVGDLSRPVLERARLEGAALVDRQRLFAAEPAADTSYHFGGRLVFAGGFLYLTVGDHHHRDQAQDLASDNGKVIRLFEDGRIPPDNPFVGRPGARPEIWSYGHRNPQGLALRPGTGELWEHEHGPMGGDEVNLILPGRNYGWPVVSWGREYDGDEINGGKRTMAGVEDPRYTYTPSIAPSGMTFYDGEAFPGWRGSLFLGGMARGHLNRLVLDGDRVVREERLLTARRWRVRVVCQGPDGFLYLGVDRFWLGEDQGMLLRVRPPDNPVGGR